MAYSDSIMPTQFPSFDETTLRSLLQQFFATSFNAILITTAEDGYPIVYANPAFCHMTGYSAEELKGKSPKIFQGERTNRKILQRLKDDLNAGSSFHGATINYRKDGEPYPVEWNISPIFDQEGRVTHFISVQKDLSNLKQIASRLKNTNEHFRGFLRDISASVEKAGVNGLMEAVIEKKHSMADVLMENAKLYTPALRSEDNVALFDENEFFDFSEDMNGSLITEETLTTLSAVEYAQQHQLPQSEIHELLDAVHDTQEQLDLYRFSGNKAKDLRAIADNINDVANTIFFLEDFVSISSVLSELATHTQAKADKELPEFMVETYKALMEDLKLWVTYVFLIKSAVDIHETDASIISSAKQLLMFLR